MMPLMMPMVSGFCSCYDVTEGESIPVKFLKMRRRTETKKIREISEGNFHSIHASNKAEKFKFSKLSQGIESCRNAQVQQYRKEERELWKTLDKISVEKSKHLSEEEQFFCNYAPGDGIAMLSLCDLSNQDDQNESSDYQEKDGASCFDNLQDCFAEEKEENLESAENEIIGTKDIEDAEQKHGESVERFIHSSLLEHHIREPPSSRRSSLKRGELSNSHLSTIASGSDQLINRNRRRQSADFEEITPFYMKKKYDHHVNNSSKALIDARLKRRRNALTLEEELELKEWNSKAPSADLDTITFRSSNIDRTWLSTNFKKEREKAIKRQSEANMEIAYQHRPLSGFRRISLALERMPSNETLRASVHSPRSVKSSIRNHSPRHQQNSVAMKKSLIRKISLPAGSGSATFSETAKEKPQYTGQRRHTIGEVYNDNNALLKKKDLPNLKNFKSFQDLDCSSELVSFNDKGVVFPAFQGDRDYTLKEFISLRKCRYLRLSKLNWESLQWQSKHQTLIDY